MDGLFIKDELPDHAAESVKDTILNNASSLDETLAEDMFQQNIRKLDIVPRSSRYGEQRRFTSLVSFGKISWQGLTFRRPILFQREKQDGNRMHIAGCDREMVGVARVLVCTITMEPQTFDFFVTGRECVDHGKRRIRGIIG